MFSAITLLLPLIVLVGVNAQDSTSTSDASLPTSGVSPCILQCLTQGLTGTSCQSITDFTCVCTDQTFQQNSRACLQANCTAADVGSATQLQQQQCASIGASGSASGSGSGTASSTTSSSRASSATSRSGNASRSRSRTTGTTTRSGISTSGSGSSTPHPSATNPSVSESDSTNTNTGNSAVAVMLTAGPGAAIASIVGLVGFIVGGGLVL